MNGCLRLAVLQQLHRRPLAGYGLMQAIRQETGWKPSPGSIYPLLTALVKDGLATVRTHGRQRIYTITKPGSETLQELLGQNRARFEKIASQLQVCSPDHRADKDMSSILERLSKGEAPFGWLTSDILEIRKLGLLTGNRDVDASKRREIDKAMRALIAAMRRAA